MVRQCLLFIGHGKTHSSSLSSSCANPLPSSYGADDSCSPIEKLISEKQRNLNHISVNEPKRTRSKKPTYGSPSKGQICMEHTVSDYHQPNTRRIPGAETLSLSINISTQERVSACSPDTWACVSGDDETVGGKGVVGVIDW
jgi:hypothetical protein